MTRSRILCVDDSPELLASLSLALETHGFDVTTARHGIDALGKFKAHSGQFDVILTDNEMPQMGGLELIRSLLNEGFAGRIVVMSGNLKLEICGFIESVPSAALLKKPFDLESMLATLSNED